MKKSYTNDIFKRITVNLTMDDNDRLADVLEDLKTYYGPVSSPPSVSLILAGVLKQWYLENGSEGLARLGNELQEASRKKSDR